MCFCCCDVICCDCLLVILAVFFPPLPVCIKRGFCSCDFLINICLCTLGWLPGTIHAWYIIATTPIIPINDEESQILIVTQPNSVVVHSHPYPSRVQFVHPEPFLEDSQHHNTLHNHTTILDRPLSPLSDPPAFLSDYGSNDNNDNIPPPTYDNVMNQTMKN